MAHLDGAWPALMTPRQADGRPNLDALRALVRYLSAKPVGGFYVNGSTGEGLFMSVPEREAVLETVLDETGGARPVVAHVGAMATADAFRLARHAQAAGAAGFASVVPPAYRDGEAAGAYYRQLAACAPELPFFMYLFGADGPALPLVRALLDVPNLAGGKYTGPDMFEFRRVWEAGQAQASWSVSSGMDEMCLAAVMAGACGNIGSTLNFMPGVYARLRERVQANRYDEALDLQLRANRVTAVLIDHGFPGALCAVMQRLGIASGEPRLPHRALAPAQIQSLHAALDRTDFEALAAL